jgi:hypothetical protein
MVNPGQVGVGLGFCFTETLSITPVSRLRRGLLEMLNSLQASCLDGH